MFLRPFGLYCRTCFGILFVSILCTFCADYGINKVEYSKEFLLFSRHVFIAIAEIIIQ